MKIELRELMDDKEMLSHIFLGCIEKEDIIKIRDKYVGAGDSKINWRTESVKIPVEMKIGGVSVNPKRFFNQWKEQMQGLISKEAKKLFIEKSGSQKMIDLQNKLCEYEEILKSWELEINWEIENPLTKN